MEALRLTSLMNDVKNLKEALAIEEVKQKIIAMVLSSNDGSKLKAAAKSVEDTLFPRKPGDIEGPDGGGNG